MENIKTNMGIAIVRIILRVVWFLSGLHFDKSEDKLKLFTGKNLWETNGNEELGIRELRVADGPHGLRKILRNEEENKHTTCFPTAVNLASTFNKKMVFNVGKYIADECLEAKVDILLGPGVNLKR